MRPLDGQTKEKLYFCNVEVCFLLDLTLNG